MKATKQYCPVMLSVYYTVQGGSMFRVCGSNPNWAVLSCGAVCYAVQGGCVFFVFHLV